MKDLIKISLNVNGDAVLLTNEDLKTNKNTQKTIEECFDKIIKTLSKDEIFLKEYFEMED